jgi:major membrane immunogen (membrane-anchored lipoprotein)
MSTQGEKFKFRVEVFQSKVYKGYVEFEAEDEEIAENEVEYLIGEGEIKQEDVVWEEGTTSQDLMAGKAKYVEE